MFDILSGYLDNGLRVVLHRIENIRTVACGIWVNQGSKYEDNSTSGASHLLEHILVNRNNKENPELYSMMKELSDNGVQYNASTTKENTSFYFKGMTDNLNQCIDTLYNMVVKNRRFDDEVIKNEKSIVEREAVSFYSSFNQIKERTSQALYGNLDVGRIIVGEVNNIRKIQKNQIIELLEKRYVPQNSTLVVVGEINYGETLEYIKNKFSLWQDKNIADSEDTIESNPGIYYSTNKNKNAVISIGLRLPLLSEQEKLSMEVAATIIGDPVMGGRLFREIREKRGLAYNVGAFLNFYQMRGTLGFTSVSDSDNIVEVVKIIRDILEDTIVKGLTEEDVVKAKKAIKTRRLLDITDIGNQLGFLGKYASNGILYSLENEIRNIGNVQLENVNSCIRNIINNDNLGMALIGNCDIDSILPVLNF